MQFCNRTRAEFVSKGVSELILNAIGIKNQLHVPIRNGLVSSLIGTFEKLSIFPIAFPRLAYAKPANEASENRDFKNVPVRMPCIVNLTGTRKNKIALLV